MSRYTGAKNRIARRFGVNIFGKARNPLLHKPNPPGVHGAKRKKVSDYGLQLNEKQKLKAVYGMLREKQLVRYYKQAFKKQGNTADILLLLLECRLDNMVYRLGLAPTIFAAHQLVAHGHIHVNGKKVDVRSFQVKPGMTISIKEKSRKLKAINHTLDTTKVELPSYCSFDKENFSGQLLSQPLAEDVSLPVEINVPEICDFLAHTT